MEVTLLALCAIVIAGSGVAMYHYEKAIRLLKTELLMRDTDIKCAELRDTWLRQSRDRAFAIRHKAAHPGELLKELYFKNTTIRSVAKRAGVAQSVIQRILAGKQAVTADAAYKFEKAYGVSALLLLQIQASHDLHGIIGATGK